MSQTLTLERLRLTTEFLNAVADDRSVLNGVDREERHRFLQAVARVYSPDRAERRLMKRAAARDRRAARNKAEQAKRSETGIQALRRKPIFHSPNVFPPSRFQQQNVEDEAAAGESAAPGVAKAIEPRHCYVCKQAYDEIHHFYDQLCPTCAALSYAKRTELADLRGRVALLTGGRVKIGYQTGLKLLRCGAHVIVTTRFPRDSAMRYAREPDFHEWADRLEIFGLDLRHTPSVEAFCRELVATRPRLDFIVNNACQTVRRPPDFYAHMMAGEQAAVSSSIMCV